MGDPGMLKRIRKEEYLRQYAAVLRAHARSAKGKASIRLIEAADFIDLQADMEEAGAEASSTDGRSRMNGFHCLVINSTAGSAGIKLDGV